MTESWARAVMNAPQGAIDIGEWVVATILARTPEVIGSRNGVSATDVVALNPDLRWPCNVGTRVRVG